jgi:UDP-2-acetamido-2,6-beta-L-arabino-hexul-4-ose reductase
MNKDNRGSFTEFIKSNDRGQVSINVSKPGIIKGNHWHKTKNEKFLVVSGTAKIRLMNLHTEEIVSYTLSDTEFQVIDIPPGYVHNIVNIGKDNLVTVMWANEQFNLQNPDTYYIEF